MSENNGTSTTGESTEPKTYTEAEFNKLQERARNFEAKVTDFEKRFNGIDPERVKATVEELEILKKNAAVGDKDKIEELLKQARDDEKNKFSKVLTEAEQKLQTTNQELDKLRVVNPAMMEAAKHFHSNELGLIQMLIERDLAYVDGEIIVKDKDGKPMRSDVDPRVNKPLTEYMQDLTKVYPNIALATGSNGSKGAGGIKDTSGGKSTATALPADWDTKSHEDKKAWFAANPQMIGQVLGNN